MSTHDTSSGFDGLPSGKCLLTALALGAVLAGCSHAPPQNWRVEPVLRVAGSDGEAAAQGYRALARQYEGEGRMAQADQAHRRAAQAAPADAPSLHALGVQLARRGEWSQGIAALRLANQLAPGQARLLNDLGYALQLSGQSDQAQAMYEAALQIDPRYDRARNNLLRLAKAPPVEPAAREMAAVQPQAAVAAQGAVDAQIAWPTAASTAVPLQLQTQPNLPAMAQLAAQEALVHGGGDPAAAPLADAADAVDRVDIDVTQPARPSTPLADVRIEILNGNGLIGAGGALRSWLSDQGVTTVRLANLQPYNMARTVVLYRPGHATQALELARRLPLPSEVLAVPDQSIRGDLRVILGHDLHGSAALDQLADQAGAHPALKAAAQARPRSLARG